MIFNLFKKKKDKLTPITHISFGDYCLLKHPDYMLPSVVEYNSDKYLSLIKKGYEVINKGNRILMEEEKRKIISKFFM